MNARYQKSQNEQFSEFKSMIVDETDEAKKERMLNVLITSYLEGNFKGV